MLFELSEFNVQCINGHVATLPVGHSLIAKCEEQKAKGRLDAFGLSADQCPRCLEGQVADLRNTLDLHDLMGMPEDEDLFRAECDRHRQLQEKLDEIEPVHFHREEDACSMHAS